MQEDDMLGGGGAGDEELFLAVAIGPTGAKDMVVVAVKRPLVFVGIFDGDLAGADSGDIAVPIDDGAGGNALDLDGVVGVFEFALGFALGDFLLKQAWPCGAGAEREAEDEERGFHIWRLVRS